MKQPESSIHLFNIILFQDTVVYSEIKEQNRTNEFFNKVTHRTIYLILMIN
jgi:hypothetical protein